MYYLYYQYITSNLQTNAKLPHGWYATTEILKLDDVVIIIIASYCSYELRVLLESLIIVKFTLLVLVG